jgi:hypothetical protein
MAEAYELVAIGSGPAGESAAELAAFAYAYKYAAFDGLYRIAEGRESLDESAKRPSPVL